MAAGMSDRDASEELTTAGGFAVPFDPNVCLDFWRQFPRVPSPPPPTRRERLHRAIRYRWYAVRLAVAQRLLPEHDFEDWD